MVPNGEYAKAKAAITKNQTAADFFIYNADQEDVRKMAANSVANLIPFSAT